MPKFSHYLCHNLIPSAIFNPIRWLNFFQIGAQHAHFAMNVNMVIAGGIQIVVPMLVVLIVPDNTREQVGIFHEYFWVMIQNLDSPAISWKIPNSVVPSILPDHRHDRRYMCSLSLRHWCYTSKVDGTCWSENRVWEEIRELSQNYYQDEMNLEKFSFYVCIVYEDLRRNLFPQPKKYTETSEQN